VEKVKVKRRKEGKEDKRKMCPKVAQAGKK
jgi:hypothetical protein